MRGWIKRKRRRREIQQFFPFHCFLRSSHVFLTCLCCFVLRAASMSPCSFSTDSLHVCAVLCISFGLVVVSFLSLCFFFRRRSNQANEPYQARFAFQAVFRSWALGWIWHSSMERFDWKESLCVAQVSAWRAQSAISQCAWFCLSVPCLYLKESVISLCIPIVEQLASQPCWQSVSAVFSFCLNPGFRSSWFSDSANFTNGVAVEPIQNLPLWMLSPYVAGQPLAMMAPPVPQMMMVSPAPVALGPGMAVMPGGGQSIMVAPAAGTQPMMIEFAPGRFLCYVLCSTFDFRCCNLLVIVDLSTVFVFSFLGRSSTARALRDCSVIDGSFCSAFSNPSFMWILVVVNHLFQ